MSSNSQKITTAQYASALDILTSLCLIVSLFAVIQMALSLLSSLYLERYIASVTILSLSVWFISRETHKTSMIEGFCSGYNLWEKCDEDVTNMPISGDEDVIWSRYAICVLECSKKEVLNG